MNRWAIVGIFLAVTGLWIGSYWVVRYSFPTMAERGQVGDTFGAVNALFSGLAFAGVLIAIWLQRADLQMQHTDLRLQQESLAVQIQEMIASREQLAEQAKAQRAYAAAMIAQLKITAIETEVRAIEMEMKVGVVSHVGKIRDCVKNMNQLIVDIERSSGMTPGATASGSDSADAPIS